MDRRAKAVARAKITKEIEARRLERSEKFTEKLAEKTAEEKAKQEAEWTSQRAKLHAILQEQEQELRAQLVTMTRDAQSTTKTLEKKQDGIGALEQMLDSQRQRLATEQKQLADVQTGFTVQEKQEAAATSEMRRLSAELLQLERRLRDLKALKSRKSDSFSLVPYRGRLGDSRQPIYVECTVAGLVVHPGPTVLDLDRRLAVTTGSVEGLDQVITDYEHRLRQAIQEHAGQLDLQKERDPRAPHIAPPTNTRSYVLFLVRPDGILSYQIAQDALHGYAIDYGYELVDPQWVFDFSSEEIAAQQQWNKDGPALPRPQIGGDRSSWHPGTPGGALRCGRAGLRRFRSAWIWIFRTSRHRSFRAARVEYCGTAGQWPFGAVWAWHSGAHGPSRKRERRPRHARERRRSVRSERRPVRDRRLRSRLGRQRRTAWVGGRRHREWPRARLLGDSWIWIGRRAGVRW